MTGHPKRIAGVVSREMPDGETVILSPDSSRAIVLNATGSVIWQLCDGRSSVEEIASFICENTRDAQVEAVTKDVSTMVTELHRAGLIEATPGHDSSDS